MVLDITMECSRFSSASRLESVEGAIGPDQEDLAHLPRHEDASQGYAIVTRGLQFIMKIIRNS